MLLVTLIVFSLPQNLSKMKLLIVACLLVASANALNCNDPHGFAKILCGVKNVAETVGGSLLDNIKDVGVDVATKLGGSKCCTRLMTNHTDHQTNQDLFFFIFSSQV